MNDKRAKKEKRYTDSNKDKGLHRIRLWIPVKDVEYFESLAKEAREKHLAKQR